MVCFLALKPAVQVSKNSRQAECFGAKNGDLLPSALLHLSLCVHALYSKCACLLACC